MRNNLRISLLAGAGCLTTIITAAIRPVHADDASQFAILTAPLPRGLSLQAAFATKARYAIFEASEIPTLALRVTGWRQAAESLLFEVRDHRGHVTDSGAVPVTAGETDWYGQLPLKNYGAGYFEVWLTLKIAGVTVPRAGSRPEGFVSYGVLPAIERLPLKWSDDSRFGAQGTNFLESGAWLQGNPYRPLYPTLGLGWVYTGARMGEREAAGPGTFKPVTSESAWLAKGDYAAAAGLACVVDLHGLPDWLLAYPAGKPRPAYTLSDIGQSYPPNDWDAYADYIRQSALEQAARRRALFPRQQHNYYQIHWEPDWHWKGSDTDFIKMYQVAFRAIHDADPDGMLLGPNYGVLATGNKLLARLLPQGLGSWLDGVATHTYYIPFGWPEAHELPAQVRELVSLTRQYLKPGAKIINTEWGTDFHGGSALKSHDLLNREMEEFMRGHLIVLGEGIDSTWYFYTADIGYEGGGGLMYNLTTPNPSFGALAIAPKPVAMAAATATRLLEGTTSLGPVGYLAKDVRAYQFDRAGRRLLVLWAQDGIARDISLPTGVSTVTALDCMGNQRQLSSPNGILRLQVGAEPSYLLGLAPQLSATNTLASAATLPAALPGATLSPQAEGPSTRGAVLAWRAGVQLSLRETAAGGVKLPRTMQPGQWLLSVCQPDLAHPQESRPLTVLPPISITTARARGSALAVTLHNQLSEAVEGTLRLRAGARVTQVAALKLSAGSTQHLDAKLDALFPLDASQPVEVEFEDAQHVLSASLPLIASYLNAREARPTMTLDATKWLLEEFSTFGYAAQMRVGATRWAGPEDLSFRIGFEYDASNLYIALKVRDQSHVQARWGNDCWKEDSVQLGIGALAEDGTWKASQKLALALRSTDGKLVVFREPHTSNLPGGDIDPGRLHASIIREGDETRYFMAIPWNEIVAGRKTIPEDRKIGVGVYVNDVDQQGGATTERKVIEGLGDGMGFFLPQRFSVINLK